MFEFIEMDRELERLVLKSPSEEEIYTHVRAKGFTTMKEDAMRKSFAGLIAFAEVNKL